MEFSEVLITYMKELHMTAKELAELTELSPSIISRYRSGQRVPAADSPQLDAIVRALGKRAKELEHPTLGKKAIRAAFEDTFNAKANAEAQLAPRLSTLMTTLGITQAAMARGCGYDPSQLSRIRKGQRLPADVEHFIDAVAAHISTNYTTTEDLQKLQSLMNVEGLSTKASVKNAIVTWLHANDVTVYYVLEKPKKSEKKEKKKAEKTAKPEKTTKPAKSTKTEKTEAVEPKQETKKPVALTDEEKELERLLGLVDGFHLQQYLRRLSKAQNRQKVITKFMDRVTTSYRNLPEIRQGIIYFLQEIAKEPVPGPLYWEDDVTGGLGVMTAQQRSALIAALIHVLQSQHTLCVAQPIAKDVTQILHALELWLPLYMVGGMRSYRVTPGAKEDYRNLSIFTEDHILYGTSVSTKGDEVLAYRKNGATEISYAMEQFQKLIREGQPLVNVYRRSQRNDFHQYLMKYHEASGDTLAYRNTLPLATIDADLLEQILKQNQVEEEDCVRIRNFHKYAVAQLKKQVKNHIYTAIYPVISKSQFTTHPMTLDLGGLFLGATVFYSYEEYEQHLEMTRAFAKNHSNFRNVELTQILYAHLGITWKEGQSIILSKDVSPANQLVISDPMIRKVVGSYLKKL